MTIELRPYQQDIIGGIRQALRDGHRTPLVQAPTGSGKSIVMAELIRLATEKGNGVLVTVPKITLVDQMSSHLDRIGIEHGVMQADHWRTNPYASVQVASLQTLIRRKKPDVKMVLVDEAHRVYRKMTELTQRWNRIPFIGFSATPWTKGLGKIYTKLIKPVEIRQLIDEWYLVDADIYAPYAPDLNGVEIVQGDYHKAQLGKRVAEDKKLIGNIVDNWHKYAKGKQTLVAATNIAHSKQIVETFQSCGVKAEHLDAYTKGDEREDKIARFISGETTMLSSVAVLSEGADFPKAECLIIARPTASRMFHIQIVGRVLRTCDEIGKERAIVIDHADNFARLGLHTEPTPDELDMGDKQEPHERVKKEKLPKVCPSCSFVKPAGVGECPQCGYRPERQNEVFEAVGELVKIASADDSDRETKAAQRRNRADSWETKIAFFAGAKHYAENKGYKSGWAAHLYKDRYSVWPNDPRLKNAAPIEPGKDVIAFITARNIRKAKKEQRREWVCRHCESTKMIYIDGKGPHHKEIRCGFCNAHVAWMPKPNKTA